MPHNVIKNKHEFSLSQSSCGTFESGKHGVTGIYTPKDKRLNSFISMIRFYVT